MRFSRLRLSGFKSFVDPTELVIGDGLTGVVGPNGCGKSNLLEALRWVMGENRPSAMRGGGMEDVIFAGADSRPARNYAEVSLLIDNAQRLAPVAFNTDDRLEIIRRITRDVGSAYKTNGKDIRARDVQMLFADASTGAHSPSLVRQGHISELVNAKPKARRRVLEEAAGISGLYQRRHEAELKLKSAQTNLLRIDDVIEQLDGQLKTLQKQARQAQRYRVIGDDLRKAEGLLLYRRWQEAAQASAKAQEELQNSTKATAQAQGEASKAQRTRQDAQDALPPLREEVAIAGTVVQRLVLSRDGLNEKETRMLEQVDVLRARIQQLGRDIEREITLNADADETIARLEWEQDEISKASLGHDDAFAKAKEAAQEAAQILQTAESELDQLTEDAARLAARHQSAQRLAQEALELKTRRETQALEVSDQLRDVKQAGAGAESAVQTAQETEKAAKSAQAQAEIDLQTAQQARSKAQINADDSRAALSEVNANANALGAEIAALERVIAREQTDGEQLIDQLRADKGYEAALGAALGDDLTAPIARDTDASGWHELHDYVDAPKLPDGVQSLGDFVTAPPYLKRRLDQIGLVERHQAVSLRDELQTGQRLVTLGGDLWRWDGFVQIAQDALSAGALRLQQINRLTELQQTHNDALKTLDVAQGHFDQAQQDFKSAQQGESDARNASKTADAALNDSVRALAKANTDAQLCTGKIETLSLAQTRIQAELNDAQVAQKDAQKVLDELGNIENARNQLEGKKVGVEAARMTMMTKRSLQDDLMRDGELRTKRRQEIMKEISGWRHRQNTAKSRIAELSQRKEDSAKQLDETVTAPEEITKQRAALEVEIKKAQTRQTNSDDALSTAESALRKAEQTATEAERNASSAREQRARAEAMTEAAAAQLSIAVERIKEDMQITPQNLLEQLEVDPEKNPTVTILEQDVMRLRRQRDALGAVNLRAEEDATQVRTDRDILVTEKQDLHDAIHELRKGIAGLNKEGRDRLLSAFDTVNKNFSMLFKRLFQGGKANLVLIESDDPLEAGLELMCQPPGKKLATLSLLSGGEQTLTAVALIFAVFLANPAPICVLDEVDAPLDDANVNRFCDLLDEMVAQTDTRFLVITHHAVTMARMDRLFGVTMAEQGVSQLVSVDLQAAEDMVVN